MVCKKMHDSFDMESKEALAQRCSKRCKFHKTDRKNLRPATLLKKRLWHRCFPVNFVKFLRTPLL